MPTRARAAIASSGTAGLLLLGGRVGDRIGHRRAFLVGVYGAVASSGAAVGLLAGGVLTEYAGWRWCLFVNVGVAGVAAVAGRAVLPATPGHDRGRIDTLSGALVTVGLVGVVLGCARAAAHGWVSPQVLLPAVAGLLVLGAFLVRQARVADPLLPPWIVADRRRAGAYLSVAVSVVGSFGMFLILTYHFQVVLGFSPVRTGLAFLPLSAAVSASAYGLGSRLLPVLAPRLLIVPGLLLATAGLGLLTTLTPGSGYATTILPAEVLLGVGMGLVFTPALSLATGGVPPRYAGVAAATATTSMQVGGSVGTAVLNTVAVSATASYLATGVDQHAALVHGYASATTWSAVGLAVAAVAAAALITGEDEDRESREF